MYAYFERLVVGARSDVAGRAAAARSEGGVRTGGVRRAIDASTVAVSRELAAVRGSCIGRAGVGRIRRAPPAPRGVFAENQMRKKTKVRLQMERVAIRHTSRHHTGF